MKSNFLNVSFYVYTVENIRLYFSYTLIFWFVFALASC